MRDSWILSGAEVARGPKTKEKLDLEIHSGRISAMTLPRERRGNGRYLDLSGCLILPGLINAHEHLEFSLFPRLGKGPYQSAADWARDIYHPSESPVREHLSIPLSVRLRWGAVKNLLSGVTTVCEHNPYRERIFSQNFGVQVPRQYGWAHSLDFAPDLQEQYQQTPPNWPFVIHLGEATKRNSSREIQQLDAIGALNHRTVLVHAVALGTQGLRLVSKRGGSIVWCPSSNFFILGQTLANAVHKSGVNMALGTDSALSGKGNLLDEIRFANARCRVRGERLYEMVTRNPARIMKLNEGQGTLREGGWADLLVIRGAAVRTPASALLHLRTGEMEMVFVRGEVKLAAPKIVKRLPVSLQRCMHHIQMEGMRRGVFTAVQLPTLLQKTVPALGSVYLAHRKIKIQ